MLKFCNRSYFPLTILAIAFFSIPFLFSGSSESAAEKEESNEEVIQQLYEKFKKFEIDTSRAAKLENFSFKKDIFEWKFESGYLYMTERIPEAPRSGGAYFIGNGRMIFEPPNKIEKAELERYTDKESLNEPFEEVFIRFNDNTRQIFEPLMKPVREGGKEAAKKFESRQRELSYIHFSLEFPLIAENIDKNIGNDYLFVETDLKGVGLIAFLYDPAEIEEITLLERQKLGFGASTWKNVISTFNKEEDYKTGIDLDYEDKDLIKINHYDMDFTIEPGSLIMDAKVGVHFQPLVEKLSLAQFDLIYHPERELISDLKITDDQGNELPFIYKSDLLVQLPKTYKKGENVFVQFSYKAKFIRPDPPIHINQVPAEYQHLIRTYDCFPEYESTFTLLNTYSWFPQYGYLKRYTFDLTIRVPKPFYAVASGTTIKRWTEKDHNCLHSKEEQPVALASILFGKYYTITDDSKRPVIHVHSLFKQQRQAKPIIQEARTVIDLYEEKIGPFPYDEIDIAQMGFFYGFGQAPPGLVQLTGEAFLGNNEIQAFPWITGKVGFRAGFMSHEIGHEWWGHVVGWRNYHEQWLSESFTEYLAGLYIEASKGPKEFEYKLNSWKKQAFDKEDFGPIWLGGRLQRGYIAALYNKGPYVLHMLRMAFIASHGFEDGNNLFFECLKQFLSEFRNQNATTKDFQQIVKKTAKVDMDWFFDQWFRDSGIPKLRFSYTVRQTEDGKYLLEGKVKQEDKEHVKNMVIPIFVHFPGDKIHELKPKFMTGPELAIKAKFPIEPELVTIDDRGDLLAEVIYE